MQTSASADVTAETECVGAYNNVWTRDAGTTTMVSERGVWCCFRRRGDCGREHFFFSATGEAIAPASLFIHTGFATADAVDAAGAAYGFHCAFLTFSRALVVSITIVVIVVVVFIAFVTRSGHCAEIEDSAFAFRGRSHVFHAGS